MADGLAALGLPLPEADRQRLLAYLGLLGKWNAVYNLTSVREPRQMLATHLLDSLAAWPGLLSALGIASDATLAASRAPLDRALRVADVGSGAGLPGIPWAIAADALARAGGPDLRFTLIDAVEKKTAFQRQAAAELGLAARVECLHGRVEAFARDGWRFDAIASRAFASLPDFVSTTAGLIAGDGRWVALKGEVPTDEIAALPGGVTLERVMPLQVPGLGDAARCVVLLRPTGALSAAGQGATSALWSTP